MKLLFPFGSVKVSKEAADLAVAFDKLQRNATVARQIAPMVAILTSSAATLEAVERSAGRARLNELITQTFLQPPHHGI